MLKIHGFGDDLLKGDVNWKAALAALARMHPACVAIGSGHQGAA